MAILSFATGTQLFVEPQLVNQASLGMVPDTWSSNQLAYQLAFRYGGLQRAPPPSRSTCWSIGLVGRRAHRHPHRTVQGGGLMRRARARRCGSRSSPRSPLFFVAPMLWLVLAPTKSDAELVSRGAVHASAASTRSRWPGSTWTRSATTSIRTWIGNSLLYASSATAIVLVTAIPAGYGLALGTLPGPHGWC